uniref:Uncharacterized protein n=1 Tax=Chlamydomonas euryale TaxID=1486919 RepID=A0A7R9VBB7_9CHLO|mmetsp:Transcript_29890/g.88483  ORF Transcript_29890/g.88483 Transcript_29890/m.88483 type:complete len:226 (+) Transcript_29890:220-897(+)
MHLAILAHQASLGRSGTCMPMSISIREGVVPIMAGENSEQVYTVMRCNESQDGLFAGFQAGFEHVYVCPLMVGTDLVPTFKALYLCSCDHDLWRRLEGAEGVHETWHVSQLSCRHATAVRQLHEAGHLPYASLSAEDVLTCIDDADFHSSAPGAYLLCAPVRRIYARLPGVNVRKHKDIVIPYFSCRGGAGNPCKPVNRRAIVTVNMTSKRYTCSGCVYSQETRV